jgi:transposase InsO family protein
LRADGNPQKMHVGVSPSARTLGTTFESSRSKGKEVPRVARDSQSSSHIAWAHLRFSIVGPLLSAPPARGELKAEIDRLSRRTWRHPVTGRPVRFAAKTIERWYYKALGARRDPVGALRRAVRTDAGRHHVLSTPFVQRLIEQYKSHPHWSVKLHVDNLRVQVEQDPGLGPMPGYSTVVRFMRAHGLLKKRRRRGTDRPGLARAAARLVRCEVRSFEAEYVNGLWHLDFHDGSRAVLTPKGQWIKPVLLGVLDDHSRLTCHAQWYWSQTAEDLVHGLSQALSKWGLPRALMTDNGPAMKAAEFVQGLRRLSIVHDPTLAYSPYQNGKQEAFWGTVEGRLMAMLEDVEELTLGLLNEATCAWAQMEYNRTMHSETHEKPLDRFVHGREVGRPSPSSEDLRQAFRQDTGRTQRRTDGTVSIEGVRFEIPSRFRHLQRVTVRYAKWNLRGVHLVDERTDTVLAPIYPVDKARNADGQRRVLEPDLLSSAPDPQEPSGEIAPLLRKLMTDYAATGLPPAYLPQPSDTQDEETS